MAPRRGSEGTGGPSAAPGPARAPTGTEPHDERARGRELALLALCHLESYPAAEHGEALSLLWRSPPRGDDERGALFANLVRDEATRRRATALLEELAAHRAELDEAITATSVRWRLSRMAQVDRNVLRLAALELAWRPRTPRPVVLSEAVRLARRYGSERSVGFVNGVAEALAQRLRQSPPPGAAQGPPASTHGSDLDPPEDLPRHEEEDG